MTPGRDHETVAAFKQELVVHGGDADHIKHVLMDMRAAYAKGVGESLPMAQINYDRFHVIALANAAMDEMRREEMRTEPKAVTRRWAMIPTIKSPRCTGCSART